MGRLQNQCLLILFTMAPRSQSHQIVSRSMSGEQIAVRLHFNHFYYVCCCRLYSMLVMVEGVKDELSAAMRDGLISVIPRYWARTHRGTLVLSAEGLPLTRLFSLKLPAD